MAESYTPEEQAILLKIARAALESATAGCHPVLPDLAGLPEALREERACFVTLTTLDGDLRGCTGTLSARQPLAHEVSLTAVQTAFNDPRFPAVRAEELEHLAIEISVLTPPQELHFTAPAQIPGLLRPFVDGIVLMVGLRRATFLPQVWDRAADAEDFLDLLCYKMGLPAGSWQQPGVQVHTYQAIVIEETHAVA